MPQWPPPSSYSTRYYLDVASHNQSLVLTRMPSISVSKGYSARHSVPADVTPLSER